ncbi:protein kinase domain-containing protein [Mariniblastus fucicola]|uniref:Serine/threonine-protein kinase PknB n=1 Tax=Mariniblastus fucicola TaxID=980251 RepID=A0A5B9P6F8_9BACT|nr:protein kinase [Mariniblastus fucicola]QEG20510.1 Serine/threonine-protein kinase PknB [Mariniblastus fucicola]
MSTLCPDKNRLESFSQGRLTEEDSDLLIVHLQDCESCQLDLETIDQSNPADTFIGELRNAADEAADLIQQEPEFRSAAVKALAALTEANHNEALPLPDSIGDYEIVRPIGRGGMGRVFLGRHTKLGRQVAIKVLAPHRRWDQRMHERFEAEMRAVGGLNHANIVAAYDARDVDGVAVLVTEFVEGLDGSDLLKRKGRLEIANACRIGAEICKALDYIAKMNLVHRDVKPSNVMIDDAGNVKLLDLGLARIQSVEEGEEFTATGQAMETADYVAPEQVNDARNVDVRTDLYGLGCTLYKMIGGRAPFAIAQYATPFAKMNAHVSYVPAALSQLRDDVPKELERLVHQLLAKKPEDRPGAASEVADQLEAFASESDLTAMVKAARALPRMDHRFERATDLKIESPDQANPRGLLFRRVPFWATVGSVLAAVCAGMLLQIAITVEKPDGTKANVVIPDGSTAVVDAEGNITLKLADGSTAGLIGKSNVSRASDAPEKSLKNLPAQVAIKEVEELLQGEPAPMQQLTEVPVSDETLNGLQPNDWVDVLTVPVFSNGVYSPSQLIASGVRFDGSIESILSKRDLLLPLTARDRTLRAHALAMGHRLTCQAHDVENVLKNDRYQLQGVWSGRLPNDVPFALAFHNNRVIFFAPGGYQKAATFDVESLKDGGHARLLRVIGSDNNSALTSEWDKAMYWFGQKSDHLQADTVFVASNSLKGIITKLTRVGNASNDVELAATRFLDDLRNEPVKLSVQVVAKVVRKPVEEIVDGQKTTRFVDDLSKVDYDKTPIITNRDFVSIRVSEERYGPTLYVSLSEFAGDKLRFVTKSSVGQHLAIVIDGEVVMAPRINSAIGSELAISGDFTTTQLQKMVKDLVPLSRQDRRTQSEDKLRQLMLGVLNYESVNQKMPAAIHKVDGSKQVFSWRVAILPFIGQKDLYGKFKFDQPWDSAHNMQVAAEMPDAFRLPGENPESISTHYLAVAGEHTILATDKPVGFGAITDGTSNTIAMDQDERAVIWTKPDDFQIDTRNQDADKPIRDLLQQQDPLFTFVKGDGEVVTISREKLGVAQLRDMLIRDDGRVIDYDLISNPDNPFRSRNKNIYNDPEPVQKGNISAERESGVVQEGLPIEVPFK